MTELSFDNDKLVSNVCKTCFFWLRQLRHVRRSLDVESVKTLVRAFVASRVDYCNLDFGSALKRVTDKLDSVFNAAARLITGTQKYERGLTRLMRGCFSEATVLARCEDPLLFQHWAPRYLTLYCVLSVSEIPDH